MGLLNKIKNVLFEEEEIEIPVEETKTEVKKEEPRPVEKKKNIYEETIKSEEPIISDNELYKAEKTFDFPIFDDQEFENMKESNLEKYLEEEPEKNVSINLFDYERPQPKKERIRPKAEEIKGRAYETKTSDFDSRKFRPSPVISPVYGVLDKNYRKEDIVVIKDEEKKSLDVAAARKKAFGTLEDDIEKNLAETEIEEKPILKKEPQEEKSIDELLEETAFDTIELPDYKEREELEDIYNDEEDAVITLDDIDEKKAKEIKEEEDETLESDLFDLIDSMYDNKEDE